MSPRRRARIAVGLGATLVALAGAARADRLEIAKGPYLQGLTSRAVVIKWEASEPSTGVVVLRGPSGAPREVKTSEKTEFHALDVGGLEPKTAYGYELRVGDAKVSGKFVTAPEGDEPFTFLAYGDSRDDHAAHEAIVRRMAEVPSDFLVNTGDMVGNGDSSSDWRQFFRIEGPLLRDRAVFACVGNHELLGLGTPPWIRYFHPGHAKGDNRRGLFHTTRWGNTRFFFLNAMVSWEKGDDVTWIQEELARAESEAGLAHRIVVMHHGPSSSGPHGPNDTLRRMQINELFRNKKVDLVLAGHDHFYERGELEGLKYLITGGAGAPLYPPKKRLQAATQALESSHHFVEVSVAGPKLSFTARRADGSTLEQCAVEASGFVCQTALPTLRRDGADVKPAPPSAPPPKKSDCDCGVPGGARPGSYPASVLALACALALGARVGTRRS